MPSNLSLKLLLISVVVFAPKQKKKKKGWIKDIVKQVLILNPSFCRPESKMVLPIFVNTFFV